MVLMKTLAIDTAFRDGRIGLVENGKTSAEERVEAGHLESHTFAAILKLGISPNLEGIDLIALAAGPGSFTGLKIGTVVAKSLSLLQRKPFKGIGTLAWMAASAGDGIIIPIIKSHGDRFYWGLYELKSAGKHPRIPRELIAPKSTNPTEMVAAIKASGYPEPDIAAFAEGFMDDIEIPWSVKGIKLPLSTLAVLAEYGLNSGGPDDPLMFTPFYVGRSQAEEKAG